MKEFNHQPHHVCDIKSVGCIYYIYYGDDGYLIRCSVKLPSGLNSRCLLSVSAARFE